MTAEAELRAVVAAWIADDPDAGDRAELQALLDGALADSKAGPGAGRGTPPDVGARTAADSEGQALAELRDRFAGRLAFGTAGLRGAVAAGPNRMNRAVVRAATAAVADWLLGARSGGARRVPDDGGLPGSSVPGDTGISVVVGCDARHRSADFADEAARVLAGAGLAVHMLPLPCPTPLVAFAVRHLTASAGVMITASHNPAADNGYKLYLSDGAQVIPPADAEIEERIAGLGPLSQIRVADAGSPLITRHGDAVARAYLDAVVATAMGRGPGRAAEGPGPGNPGAGPGPGNHGAGPGPGNHGAGPGPGNHAAARVPGTAAARPGPGGAAAGPASGKPGAASASGTSAAEAALGSTRDRAELNVVYTPMHGVAGELMLRAIGQAGFAPPHVVAAQAEPDPDFPTVAFPNPEEPGALDLAMADATRLGADLVLASDPDGDRLAVAVPRPEGGTSAHAAAGTGWLMLTGDQVGAVLGAGLLDRTAGDAAPETRLVASTIVSSTLLSKIAAGAGVRYAETLTGFKWIARAADGVPGTRFIFGYEEALGYAVGDVVRDKDGIGAALAMLRLAAEGKAAGRSVLQLYDALEIAHGVHLTSQLTLRTADQAQVMSRLRADPPAQLGGHPVTSLIDLAAGERGHATPGTGAAADVLIFRLPGARAVVRPSGTEPKLKCYIEIVESLAGRPLPDAREAAARRLVPLRHALEEVLADG